MVESIFKIPKFLPTSIVSVVVLYLTLFPDPVPESEMLLFPFADKVVHLLMFLGVGACLMLDLGRVKHFSNNRNLPLVCILVAFAFGWLIEILQLLMALGRSYDNWDLVADGAGAIVGVLICRSLLFSKNRTTKCND